MTARKRLLPQMQSATSKLFTWEGIKKELFWIFFILFIIFIAWSYNSETKVCKEIQKTECFSMCYFDEGVKRMQLENPDLQFMCNRSTLSCDVYGVSGLAPKFTGGFNITIQSGDSNNSFQNPRQT